MQLKENQQIIEQILYPQVLSKEDRQEMFMLFRENFDLFLKYDDLIINTPEFFHCSFGSGFISVAYLGGYPVSLGALLQLWKTGEWVVVCNQCQGKLYLYGAGGSPLSGSNSCCGICKECKTVSTKILPSFLNIVKTLASIRKSQNRRKILRTKSQHFDFGKGLVGAAIPDKILRKEITPVNIIDLICILKKRNSEYKQDISAIKTASAKTTKEKIINVNISDFMKNIRV